MPSCIISAHHTVGPYSRYDSVTLLSFYFNVFYYYAQFTRSIWHQSLFPPALQYCMCTGQSN